MPQRNHQRFTEPAADSWQRVRGLFVDDWGLKLLALAITRWSLWFMVSGRIAQREVMVEAKPEGKPGANIRS